MTVRKRLQAAIDSAGVKAFWRRRVDVNGDETPDEYVVYTLGGCYDRVFSDDEPLISEKTATVRYYCLSDHYGSEEGRTAAEARVAALLGALHAAGFVTPSGAFDAGDIDDSGYDATVIECSLMEAF